MPHVSAPHAMNVPQDQQKLDSNPATSNAEATDVVPPPKGNLDVASSLNAPVSNVYLSYFPLAYSASSVPPLAFYPVDHPSANLTFPLVPASNIPFPFYGFPHIGMWNSPFFPNWCNAFPPPCLPFIGQLDFLRGFHPFISSQMAQSVCPALVAVPRSSGTLSMVTGTSQSAASAFPYALQGTGPDLVPFEDKTFLPFSFSAFFLIGNQPPLLLFISLVFCLLH